MHAGSVESARQKPERRSITDASFPDEIPSAPPEVPLPGRRQGRAEALPPITRACGPSDSSLSFESLIAKMFGDSLRIWTTDGCQMDRFLAFPRLSGP